jgi:hypothetical protein
MKELKQNEVVEVLPDGTVYYFDLDVCNNAAEQAMEKLLELEGVEPNFDFTASVFHLFVEAIYILTNSGWSTEELLTEVLTHSDANDNITLEFDDQEEDDEDD